MDETTKAVIERIAIRYDQPTKIPSGDLATVFYDCFQLSPSELARLAADAIGDLDHDTFDMADAIYWIEKMQEDEEAGIASDNLIKPPEIFKKDEEWLTWSEQFITYARSKKGKNNGTPIAYIICEHNLPTPDMTFPTETDEKIGRAILTGPL